MSLATSGISTAARQFATFLSQPMVRGSSIMFQARTIFQAIREYDYKKVKTQLKANPNLINEKEKGDLPLHCLASGGALKKMDPVNAEPPKKLIKLVIGRTKDIDTKNSEKETALHIAARKGYFTFVTELLKSKARRVELDCYGRLPFYVAITSFEAPFDPNMRIPKTLLKQQYPRPIECPDYDWPDHFGITPLVSLIESIPGMVNRYAGNSDTLNRSALCRLEQEYIPSIEKRIRFLLAQGFQGTYKFMHHTATDLMVRKLDPFPQVYSSHWKRYEDRAFRSVLPELAKMQFGLIERPDENGWTLLHWAAYVQSEELAKYLLSQGFDAGKKCHNELAPGHLAIMNLNKSLSALLMPDFDLDQVSLEYLSELVIRLPSRGLPYYALRSTLHHEDSCIKKFYSTGIPAVSRENRVGNKILEMYLPYTGNQVISKMASFIHKKDFSAIQSFASLKWNVSIDNDFVFNSYLLFSYSGICTVSHALDELIAKGEDAFYQKVLSELVSSKKSGITLSSELDSAFYDQRFNLKKVFLVLKAGLTPEIYKQECGKDLVGMLFSLWNANSNADSESYQEILKILNYAFSKDWITSTHIKGTTFFQAHP